MKNFRVFIIISLLLTGSLFCGNSELDSLLQIINSEHALAGMSVTVVKGDDIVFSGYYGKRDIGRNLDTDLLTKYRIASISKTITTMALMKLYDQGVFSLEDDISDYLGFQLRHPSYPTQKITVGQILSHTSSLRDGSGYSPFLSATYYQDTPPALKQVLQQGGVYYSSDMFGSKSPDSKYFQYANINFGVIGTMIENLSGKRFDIYVKEEILEPLGLTGSFNVNTLPDINNLAALYRKQGSSWSAQADNYKGVYPAERDLSGYIIGQNGAIFAPQGGLRISSNELAVLMLTLNNGGEYSGVRIFSDTTATVMFTNVWNYNGSNGNNYYGIFNNYALGNHTTTELVPGEVLTGHPGEAYGLISDMYFSRVKDYGIIFITNGGSWNYGNYSGWYDIEEEVFSACYSQIDNLTSTHNKNENERPERFSLAQNYPNPFNPETSITVTLGKSEICTIKVFDVLGRIKSTIHEGYLGAGTHKFNFKANNLPGGVYFYNYLSASHSVTRKMILLK